MLTRVFATAALIAGAMLTAGSTPPAPERPAARVVPAAKHDRSRALREIPPVPPVPLLKPEAREPGPRHRGRGPRGVRVDTVVQTFAGESPGVAPSQSFDGISNVNAVLPPDTNGDVGPSHYVQWVNLSFAIYSKGAPGMPPALIYGPAAGNTLWSGFGGPCEATNNGDPIVLYDHLADRWIMSQLALPNMFFGLVIGPFYQCVAVSATGDPTGAYHRYQFAFDKLNDYPKLGVWPDAYYMTMNQFSELSVQYAGQGVVAFDRASMLAGRAASMIYFDLAGVDMNLGGMLPADLDGAAPPAGAPGYFAQIDDDAWGYSGDQVQLWRFHADWSRPSASTFTRAAVLPTEPFDSDLCGYARSCIPQPGTTAGLDTLADRLMYRLQYRNFGDHESLIANHSVDVDGGDHAGIRWYEIREPQTAPIIYQQGTYAPDADHRWLASAAMDRSGNLAIGYSVSSGTTAPSIRYAGRLAADPPGILTQAEVTLVAGAGAQTHTSGRWGDYSMLAVDPVDDCTFWYTQEYYSATSSSAWRTRIGAFAFPSCEPSPNVGVTIAATTTPALEAGLVPGSFTITRSGDTSQPVTIQYFVAGTATPGVDYVALPGNVTMDADSTSAVVTVTPTDDSLFESDETVAVTLTADTAYRVAWPASATVLIASDDLPPDLVVTAISSPGATAAGATISVSDTTKNQGTGAAGESITGFYLSADTKFDTADVRLGTRTVPSLGAGAISTAPTVVQIPASVATGTYYVIARADDSGVVPEHLESNNVKASAAVQVGPDLVVSALSGPPSAAAGGAVTPSVTTTNQGGAAAESSSTAFYLSSNVFLETSDPLLGSRTVPALGAGASDAASMPVTIPASTVPGQYYIIAKADSNGTVVETQELNNQRLGPYMKIGPDLIVASVSVPSAAGPGMALTVTDKTSNAGGATAPDSRTSFFLSTNLSLDASDQWLGSRVVPSLGVSEASTASTPVQIPAATPIGTYYVIGRADSENAVVESVETNNVSSPASVRIGPDLVIASISAPGTGGAAGTITIPETTKNQGGATSPASTTMFYLSTNGSLDAADVLLGQRAVPELAGGVSSAATTSLPIPSGTVTGSYYLIAKADGLGVVVESNETNNLSYGVLVRVGPDLVVSSLVVPGSAAIGSPIAVTDTTTNQGNRPAPSSTTRFYLSTNYTLDAADVLIGSRAVGALDSAGSNTAATTVTIPAGTAAGAYYVIAVADGESTVGEAVETNNTRAVYIRIS